MASVLLTDEKRADIVRLYWSGLTTRQIEKEVSVTYPRVVQVLIEAGGRLPDRNGGGVSDERIQAAERLFESGASRMEVARTLGINEKALRSWFPEYKWSFQQSGSYRLSLYELNDKIDKIWNLK